MSHVTQRDVPTRRLRKSSWVRPVSGRSSHDLRDSTIPILRHDRRGCKFEPNLQKQGGGLITLPLKPMKLVRLRRRRVRMAWLLFATLNSLFFLLILSTSQIIQLNISTLFIRLLTWSDVLSDCRRHIYRRPKLILSAMATLRRHLRNSHRLGQLPFLIIAVSLV